jgi:Mg2+ and Co2+ transporter CorA
MQSDPLMMAMIAICFAMFIGMVAWFRHKRWF